MRPKLKRILALACVLAFATLAHASVWHDTDFDVSTAGETLDLQGPKSTVSIESATGSATAYFELYWCDETAWAATVASIPIAAGTIYKFQFNPNEHQARSGYCFITAITAADTATFIVVAK